MDARTTTTDSGRIDAREASLSDFGQWTSPDLFEKARRFQGFLADWHGRGFDRYMLPVLEYRGGRALVRSRDGNSSREVSVFCSADYLGLAQHPLVVEAARAALVTHGASVSSVPAIAGSTDLHRALEAELAAHVGAEACVLFPTGHAANIGTIGALCSSRDLVLVDKQIHYSFIEGIRTAGCRWESFRHSDPDHLAAVLERAQARRTDRGILVVAEGVYGVDGDLAPLAELQAVARRFGARLMLDDAHGTGVLGPSGAGTAAHLGLAPPDLLMGSLSKSLGSLGGWIATDRATAEFLRYFARSIVFSVGLPAVQAAAASAALRCLKSDPALMDRLRTNSKRMSDGIASLRLPVARVSGSAIHSVVIGSEPMLRDVVRDLFEQDVWAEGLPVPAVARGEERVRFRVRACHELADIDCAVEVLAQVLRRHRVIAPLVAVPTASQVDGRGAEASEAVQLALDAARAHGHALPWINRNAQRRVIDGVVPWDAVALNRCVFVERSAGRDVACAVAYVCQVNLPGGPAEVGMIGDIAMVPGHTAHLSSVMAQALQWLRLQVREVLAPAQPPLQVRGGGVRADGETGGKPFLEPTVPPEVQAVLEALGFEPRVDHTYTLHALDGAGQDPRGDEVPGVELTPLDRADFRRAVVELHPLVETTLAFLPYCGPLDAFSFLGIASEMRELILPGLWTVARRGGRPVGLAAAFPNVTEAFRSAQGVAGVADVEILRMALDTTRQGFLAWLAAEPGPDAEAIGRLLAAEAFKAMRRRGMDTAWVSWEVAAGSLTAEAVRDDAGPVLRTALHRIYGIRT